MTRKLIIRTGLALMLTGLFFVLVSTISPVHANDKLPLESDSVLLAKHVRELKIEYALEEFSDHSFNAGFSDTELDSILRENQITVTGGDIVYSPDSVFRFFVVNGKSCGAYCNPFWKTWLHFNDGSGMVISNSGFERVTHVEIMPDGKYLVWEDSWGRGGAVSYEERAVTLFSLKDHTITYFPFPTIPSQDKSEGHDPQGSFCVYQNSNSEDNLLADYNPDKKRLEYQYTLDNYGYDTEDDSLTVYSGYFEYRQGLFQFSKETVTRKKPRF